MLKAIGRLTSRYPRWVLAAWLAVFALSLPFAARVSTVLTAQPDVPPGSVASSVVDTLRRSFDLPSDYTLVLVARGIGSRVGEPAFERSFSELARRIRAIAGVSSLRDYRGVTGLDLVAPDGSYTAALVSISARDLGEGKAVTDSVRTAAASVSGLVTTLAGGPATAQELERVSERDASRAESFGLPISLVILIVAFGALVASGLPLLVAVTSVSVSLAVLYALGQFVEFAVFTQTIITMLGLATGIDYALLMVNRFREELRHTFDPRVAAERTAVTAGQAVAFSGLTVVIALLALLVPPLSYVRSIGVGTILVLLVSVLVSLTALPAVLALLGHRVNWLRITRREPGMRTRQFWRNRVQSVLRHRVAWAVAGAGVLILLGLPALRMQVADPGPRGLSPATDARKTLTALKGLGLEGMLSSFDVLVDFGERGFFHPASVRQLSQFDRAVQAEPLVEAVSSPMAVSTVPRLFLYQYYASREVALSSEVAPLVRATVSTSGRYALVRVYPGGTLTPAQGSALRAHLLELARGADLSVQIGGGYERQAEWARVLYGSFPLALAMVYLATMVLLGLAFRSLLIPLKAIVLNTLTVAAAYGIITMVFQDGVLSRVFGGGAPLGYVDTSAPMFIFAIVFGLSMDYEVFLVARIREAHDRGLGDREAVISSLAATGGVITSAAAVMITVFAVFLFSHVLLIRTLGLGLTVAVLLDATLVRTALVPAVMSLAGRWNWWLPGPLRRVADRLDLGHD